MMMIKAVIFDMDGLLIDSEPLWQESEIEVFGRVGLRLDHTMCLETMGMRVDAVVDYWHERRPWENVSKKEIEMGIIDEVVERILLKATPKEGAASAISFVQGKGARVALASSSSYRIIRAVLDKFDLQDKFELLHSAEEEEHGKPHPAVYLTTARKLQVRPQECLAIEDSFNGVLAAKEAGMRCIAVPDSFTHTDPRFELADIRLNSLSEINDEVWAGLNTSEWDA
jgi:mannitol-1-/sugar-/sorbitol-6-/2-deoxyglucose-6-phosphatase